MKATGKGENIMEQIGNELKKMLKAGLGAVAAGAEMAQDAIENLSRKGEPLYQQAKSAVSDAADKIRDAMTCKPSVLAVIDQLRTMTREDWALVRAALDDLEAQADAPAGDAAPDTDFPPAEDGAADAEPQPDAPDAEDEANQDAGPSAE